MELPLLPARVDLQPFASFLLLPFVPRYQLA